MLLFNRPGPGSITPRAACPGTGSLEGTNLKHLPVHIPASSFMACAMRASRLNGAALSSGRMRASLHLSADRCPSSASYPSSTRLCSSWRSTAYLSSAYITAAAAHANPATDRHPFLVPKTGVRDLSRLEHGTQSTLSSSCWLDESFWPIDVHFRKMQPRDTGCGSLHESSDRLHMPSLLNRTGSGDSTNDDFEKRTADSYGWFNLESMSVQIEDRYRELNWESDVASKLSHSSARAKQNPEIGETRLQCDRDLHRKFVDATFPAPDGLVGFADLNDGQSWPTSNRHATR